MLLLLLLPWRRHPPHRIKLCRPCRLQILSLSIYTPSTLISALSAANILFSSLKILSISGILISCALIATPSWVSRTPKISRVSKGIMRRSLCAKAADHDGLSADLGLCVS